MHLIECIISATKQSMSFSNCITKPVRMSGWNNDMSIAREKSLLWHGLWILCGKLETFIYFCMYLLYIFITLIHVILHTPMAI